MAKKAKKLKKSYVIKKPININIGTIIFLFIFVYLVIIVFNYFSKDKIHIYEVVEGSLASNSYYTGLILRNEEIYTAEQAGYVNFYMKQGDRTGNGNLICLLDESGADITSKLSENSEDANNLSMENLGSLRKQLTEYSTGYDPMEFDAIYDVKYKLQSMLWEYVSAQALEELQNAAAESGSHFQLNYAPKSGILEYYTDGFETLTPEQITADHFKASDYKKNYIKSGDMVEAGSPIYKLIGSDEWSPYSRFRRKMCWLSRIRRHCASALSDTIWNLGRLIPLLSVRMPERMRGWISRNTWWIFRTSVLLRLKSAKNRKKA